MVASDSLRFVNSFVNLETCFDFFEDKFGAYPFSRVGYVVVPFTGGAMEHATNIAYSRSLVNGTTSNECDFMAHELSHMWFGDKATCRTAEDMWLNEGWATFSGSLFKEHQQGRQAYDDELRTRHDQVLRFTHIKEGGYQALSDVPWQYTYGEHVYNKGADVVHSLRGFLGDTVFFTCVKNYLSQYAYKDVSSQDLQESFEQTSGKNLQAFFDAFVYHGGFLDVVLDSFQVSGQGPYQVTVFTHQSIKGPAWACNQLPTELTLIDENRNKQSFRVPTNEAPSSFTFTSGILPKLILINESQSLALAQTAITKTLAVPGAVALSPVKFNLNVLSLSDTALCKVTQHYTGPSGFPSSSGYRVSQERYFSVEGIFPPGFKANGSFIYDGRSFATSGTQYFDNLLINETEDSLFLFYRENAAQPWMLFPYYTKIMGSATDKFGTMQIDSLLPGDYVLAMKDETAGLSVHEKSTGIEVYPNPAGDILQVKFPSALSPAHMEVYDALGKMVFRKSHPGSSVSLNVNDWPSGIYLLKAQDCSPLRFIVAH
jgi:aminopeptidase N